MSRMSQSMYDRHITIFSPEGTLYQVEYAFRAVKSCNITAIAVKGDDSAVIVAQKKLPLQQQQQDKLLDQECVTSLQTITPHIGASMIGIPGDCRSMTYRSRQIATEFEFQNGYKIPIRYLTHKIANINQLYTQHAYMRLHACTGIFISYDEEEGPAVYRFDPAGWYAHYKACAAGVKEQEAASALEKVVKRRSRSNETETIEAAISCLQTVLSVDFKPNDIEVGVVSKEHKVFRLLTESEIETHLTTIAERD